MSKKSIDYWETWQKCQDCFPSGNFHTMRILKLSNREYPVAYHSPSPISKAKGVSTLLARSVSWSQGRYIADEQGRFLIVKGPIGATPGNIDQCVLSKFESAALSEVIGPSEFGAQRWCIDSRGQLQLCIWFTVRCLKGCIPFIIFIPKATEGRSKSSIGRCMALTTPQWQGFYIFSLQFIQRTPRIDFFSLP